jgi:hypothetical protein
LPHCGEAAQTAWESELVMLKLSGNGPPLATVTDAELLGLLFKAIQPTVLTRIGNSLSRKLSVLATCLVEQEKLVLHAPDFSDKEAVLQQLTAARLLCETIEAEVSASVSNFDVTGAAA